MSGMFSSPDPPSAKKTIEAQTQANINAAGASSYNQNTPTGKLTYSTNTSVPAGTPGRTTVNQTLSPNQQALLTGEEQLGIKGNETGLNLLNNASSTLNDPVNFGATPQQQAFDPNGVGAHVNQYYDEYIAPRVAQDRERLEQRLANQGIFRGDGPETNAAYRNAERDFDLNTAQARDKFFMDQQAQAFQQDLAGQGFNNQTVAQNRDRTIQDILLGRNQTMNELNALRNGSQLANQQWVQGPAVQPTDVAGIRQNAYNTQAQNYQAMLGGIGGIGGAIAGAESKPWYLSDRRAKTDIKKVGKLDDGTKVYSYRYKGSPMMQMGVMAQEVEKTHPEAVATTESGLKVVNYAKIAEVL